MDNLALLPKRATVAELAAIFERSEKVVRECINAVGAKRGKDKKYPVAPIAQEHLRRQKRNTRRRPDPAGIDPAAGSALGPPMTWSDQVKATQCEKMEVQIGALLEHLIPKTKLEAEVVEICGVCTQALEELVQWVTVTFRDPVITKKAKELRDRTKRWADAKCGELETVEP